MLKLAIWGLGKTMKGFVAAVAIVVVVLLGVIVGAKLWNSIQARDKAEGDARKTVAESSIACQQLLADDLGNNNITFAELFDRIDARLKNIDDAAVSISASPLPEQTRDGLSGYLHRLQDVLRLEENKYRKGLAASNALDSANSASSDYKATPYNEYSDSWERRSVIKSLEEASKAEREAAEATKVYWNGLKGLQSFLSTRPQYLNGYTTIDAKQLDGFVKHAAA